MKKIIMTFCSLVACLSMNAQANLQINDFSIKAGEKKTITLDLVNPDTEVSGFNCVLFFPEGITVDKKKTGKYNFTFNADAERDVSHTVSSGDKNGGISIVVMSMEADELVGESGDPVLDIPVTASESIESGTYQIKVTAQDIVNCTGTKSYKPEDYICTVTVEGVLTGINGVNGENVEAVYNLSGQKISNAHRGINIVQTNNGVKKTIKK